MLTAGLVALGVTLGIKGLGWLAGRTRNPVDDRIVAAVRSAAPQIIEAIEKAVEKPAPRPERPRTVDHRRK